MWSDCQNKFFDISLVNMLTGRMAPAASPAWPPQSQLSDIRQGRMQDEFKTASSQILCLKEAVNFTARCAPISCHPWLPCGQLIALVWFILSSVYLTRISRHIRSPLSWVCSEVCEDMCLPADVCCTYVGLVTSLSTTANASCYSEPALSTIY